MTSQEKIIDRIRKILSRAESSNVHEAATAAAMAQQLMQQHKLSQTDLEVSDEGSPIEELSLGVEDFKMNWKRGLIHIVAKAFFCEAVFRIREGGRGSRKAILFGKIEDTMVAVETYKYLLNEIDRLAEEYARERHQKLVSDTYATYFSSETALKNDFRKGAVLGVRDRLEEDERRFKASSEKALVLMEKSQEKITAYLKHKFPMMRDGAKIAMKTEDHEAYAEGYLRGNNLQVKPDKKTLPEVKS